jgi:hypothetical protein
MKKTIALLIILLSTSGSVTAEVLENNTSNRELKQKIERLEVAVEKMKMEYAETNPRTWDQSKNWGQGLSASLYFNYQPIFSLEYKHYLTNNRPGKNRDKFWNRYGVSLGYEITSYGYQGEDLYINGIVYYPLRQGPYVNLFRTSNIFRGIVDYTEYFQINNRAANYYSASIGNRLEIWISKNFCFHIGLGLVSTITKNEPVIWGLMSDVAMRFHI